MVLDGGKTVVALVVCIATVIVQTPSPWSRVQSDFVNDNTAYGSYFS